MGRQIRPASVYKTITNEMNRTQDQIKEKEVGWLVRTKGKDSNEGGVAAGFSVLDSIVLVD